jgi:predicted DNA-binding transcriptional regulator AlpA
MSPDDLLGLIDVARVLGISQSTAKNYARRPDFPTPQVLSRGRVWRRADVEKWAKILPLKPGPRPRAE